MYAPGERPSKCRYCGKWFRCADTKWHQHTCPEKPKKLLKTLALAVVILWAGKIHQGEMMWQELAPFATDESCQLVITKVRQELNGEAAHVMLRCVEQGSDPLALREK